MGWPLDKQCFAEAYGSLLELLDGTEKNSFIDWFFQPSPINTLHWEFVNNNARDHFVTLSINLGLSLSLQELCEGESIAERESRKCKL